MLHDAADLCKAFDPFQGIGCGLVVVVAEVGIELIEHIGKRLSHILEVSRHFTDKHGRNDRIFILCVRPGKVAVAFFIAEEEVMRGILFPLGDLFSNILEAGQRFYDLQAIAASDFCTKLAGHDRFYHGGCRCQRLFSGEAEEVCQECAHLISGNQDKVLPFSYCAADAVTVRVSPDDDICAHFFGEGDSHRESIFILRIWRRNGREVAIRQLLLLHDMHIGETGFRQNGPDGLCPAAVKRCVDDGERRRISLIQGLPEDRGQKAGDGFMSQPVHEGIISLIFDMRKICHRFDISRQDVCILRHQLRAIGTIDLVSIVFCRIVARCHDHTGRGMEIFDRKRKDRNGFEFFENADGDPGRCQHTSGFFRKVSGMISGIIGNDHAL